MAAVGLLWAIASVNKSNLPFSTLSSVEYKLAISGNLVISFSMNFSSAMEDFSGVCNIQPYILFVNAHALSLVPDFDLKKM